jgi:hypothetical protein
MIISAPCTCAKRPGRFFSSGRLAGSRKKASSACSMFCRFTCTSCPTWKMSRRSWARRVISSRRPPSSASIGASASPAMALRSLSVTVFAWRWKSAPSLK